MIDARAVADELTRARACRLAAEAASLDIEELLWEMQRSAVIWRRLALVEPINELGLSLVRQASPPPALAA